MVFSERPAGALPRYGLDVPGGGDVTAFPAQSSVLDEEALLERVVRRYRIPTAMSCLFYCRGDADIYRVTTTDGDFYLKVYRPPQTALRTEAEARFVAGLASRGVRVVRAVPRQDGAFATEVTASEGPRPMLLFEEAPEGRVDAADVDACRRLGRAVAELHDAADALDPIPGLAVTDIESITDDTVPFARRLLPEDDFRFLEDVIGRIRARLADVPRDPPGFGACHNDLVLSNIRQDGDGRITFFDFGNVSRTYRSFELGVLHLSLKNNERGQEALLEGYAEVRALPPGFEESRSLFLLLRRVSWLGGVLASCPLRLGVENFGPEFANEVLAGIRELVEEVPWRTA